MENATPNYADNAKETKSVDVQDFEEAEIVEEPKEEPKAVEQPVTQPQVDDDDF
jgi:hypothetical protein